MYRADVKLLAGTDTSPTCSVSRDSGLLVRLHIRNTPAAYSEAL